MRVQLNKLRKPENIFLTLLLACALAGLFVFFFTIPVNRDFTLWMSIGFLAFAGVLSVLFASRTASRSSTELSGYSRHPPLTFVQLLFAFLYVVFVIIASLFNVFVKMTVPHYFLLHVAIGLVFLLPLRKIAGEAVEDTLQALLGVYTPRD